ncbi:MAG: RnfABCDGE type electron transport complex subunit D [Eubacteriales bacterium]|nr:RnfABCDGE type electron transport complex subunit D [Eubacteriales bacterium]
MEHKLLVSSSPHIHQNESIASIMLDVIIALIPASLMGVYYFGYKAAVVIITAIAASVLSEYAYQKITKKTTTVSDLSAIVTGLLLALNLPVTIPLWMVVIGSAFAIIIVKQLYGGLGKNFMNPALAARCFMVIAWGGAMSAFVEPFVGYGADAISQATPLGVLKGISEGTIPSVNDAFFGVKPGTIGETSGAMLLLGGLYLLYKRVISWHIPTIYILSFGVLTYFLGNNNTQLSQLNFTLLSICTGGLLLGAIFMATDYVTTPTTKRGQVVFAVGCGLLTFVIRRYGSYPEGASFAILLMNIATPLIDRYIKPKKFGYVKKK